MHVCPLKVQATPAGLPATTSTTPACLKYKPLIHKYFPPFHGNGKRTGTDSANTRLYTSWNAGGKAMLETRGWTVAEWQEAYRNGRTPRDLLRAVQAQLDSRDPAWISLTSTDALEQALQQLDLRLAAAQGDIAQLPLYGIPFAVKDNIDAAGLPTTCACPAFAGTPAADATVVTRLREAGAIVLGKTNLDQFATGLVGTRSPYGVVPNTFDAAYICGGSSSGSASVVARGLVPFALGTDTAGSGRVPAGFNNLVGLKPSLGLLSTQGVVPACRTLDCVSIFALTVAAAFQQRRVLGTVEAATLLLIGLALLGLATLWILRPQLLAWPMAALALWLAIIILLQAWRLWQRPAPRAPED